MQIQEEEDVIPPKPEPVPDAIQISEIIRALVSVPDASNDFTIRTTGDFPEKVRYMDVNDHRIPPYSWVRDRSTITFAVLTVASGTHELPIWNGSIPLLQVQTIEISTK